MLQNVAFQSLKSTDFYDFLHLENRPTIRNKTALIRPRGWHLSRNMRIAQ